MHHLCHGKHPHSKEGAERGMGGAAPPWQGGGCTSSVHAQPHLFPQWSLLAESPKRPWSLQHAGALCPVSHPGSPSETCWSTDSGLCPPAASLAACRKAKTAVPTTAGKAAFLHEEHQHSHHRTSTLKSDHVHRNTMFLNLRG